MRAVGNEKGLDVVYAVFLSKPITVNIYEKKKQTATKQHHFGGIALRVITFGAQPRVTENRTNSGYIMHYACGYYFLV